MKIFNQYSVSVLAGVAVLVSGAFAQDEAKVTLKLPSTTLEKALLEINKVSGSTLKFGAALRNDILAIDVANVGIDDLKAKIADVLGAEWVKEEVGFRLVRPEPMVRAQKKLEIEERSELIKSALAEAVKKVEGSGPFTAESMLQGRSRDGQPGGPGGQARMGGPGGPQFAMGGGPMGDRQPAGRAVIRILSKMDPKVLAAIEPGQRVVFSTVATASQKAMPGAANTIIADFVKENKIMRDGMRGGRPGGGPGGPGGEGPAPADTVVENPPAITLLIATRVADQDAINFNIVTADRDGRPLANGFYGLTPSVPKPAATSEKIEDESKLAFTPATLEMAEKVVEVNPMSGSRMQFGGGGPGAMVVGVEMTASADAEPADAEVKDSADWRKRSLNPEIYEPLATVPYEVVSQLSRRAKFNLVASFPDSALSAMSRGLKDLTVKTAWSKLSDWGLDVTNSEGWMVVKPHSLVASRDSRVDRKALGTMLRILADRGELNLDERANFTLAMPRVGQLFSLDQVYATWVNPSAAGAEFGRFFRGQREMLRFYATLSSGQRQNLIQGMPIPLNTLNNFQRETLNDMVFNSLDGPSVGRADAGGTAGPGGGGPGGRRFGGAEVSSERTIVLPNGLPLNGRLVVDAKIEAAVYGASNGGGGGIMSASELGRSQAFNNVMAQSATIGATPSGVAGVGTNPPGLPSGARPGRRDPAARMFGMNQYDKYRMIEVKNMTFTFQLAQRVNLVRTLEDANLSVPSKFVSLSELPAAFLNDVNAAAERVRSSMNTVGGTGGGPRRGRQNAEAP